MGYHANGVLCVSSKSPLRRLQPNRQPLRKTRTRRCRVLAFLSWPRCWAWRRISKRGVTRMPSSALWLDGARSTCSRTTTGRRGRVCVCVCMCVCIYVCVYICVYDVCVTSRLMTSCCCLHECRCITCNLVGNEGVLSLIHI